MILIVTRLLVSLGKNVLVSLNLFGMKLQEWVVLDMNVMIQQLVLFRIKEFLGDFWCAIFM